MKGVWKKRFNCKINSHFYFENIFKMPKSKRSQIAIFIILGILIVAAIAAFLTSNISLKNKSPSNINSYGALPIYNFVGDCVKLTGNDAIYQIGKTGGYVATPQPRMEFEENFDEGVAFYLYDAGKTFNDTEVLVPSLPSATLSEDIVIEKENYMPKKEVIEKELSLYMDSFLYYCLDFSRFSDFNISGGKVKTITRIENGKVIFNVEYPLTISRENDTYFFSEFKSEVPVRLNEIYSLTSEIMDSQMQKQDSICMSCIYDLSNKYDMKVKMMDAQDGIVFLVLDEKSKINNASYSFYFANKYD